MKTLIIILTTTLFATGGVYLYHYEYMQTLMLSEIVGETDEPLVNIAASVFDFDTGLTRHDLNEIMNSKDYWIERMQYVESINEQELYNAEMAKLLHDMMKDPHYKKLADLILSVGFDVSSEILSLAL